VTQRLFETEEVTVMSCCNRAVFGFPPVTMLVLFCLGTAVGAEPAKDAQPVSLDSTLVELTGQMVAAMPHTTGKTLVVVDLADLNGEVTTLGVYVAEEVVTLLTQTRRFGVVDRRLLDRINAGSRSADYTVSGVIADLGGTLKINLRAVMSETGVIVAAVSAECRSDSAVRMLLGGVDAPQALPKGGATILEGESLRVINKTAGTTMVNAVQYNPPMRWSGGAHLGWAGARPGDKLELAIPVTRTGEYILKAQLTKAADYAIVHLYLDGDPLGKPIDLFNGRDSVVGGRNDVTVTGALDFGAHSLAKGEHKLTVELVGVNPKAEKRYFVGLDYVELDLLK
jgi:hypothetical protein